MKNGENDAHSIENKDRDPQRNPRCKRVEVRSSLRQFRRDFGNTSVEGERNDQTGSNHLVCSIVLRTRPRASRRANRRTSFERSWDQLTARKRAGLYSFETLMIACERMAPLHPYAVSPEPTVLSSNATNERFLPRTFGLRDRVGS